MLSQPRSDARNVAVRHGSLPPWQGREGWTWNHTQLFWDVWSNNMEKWDAIPFAFFPWLHLSGSFCRILLKKNWIKNLSTNELNIYSCYVKWYIICMHTEKKSKLQKVTIIFGWMEYLFCQAVSAKIMFTNVHKQEKQGRYALRVGNDWRTESTHNSAAIHQPPVSSIWELPLLLCRT